MIRRLRNLSLSRKLTLLLTATAALGVFFAFVLLAINEIRTNQHDTLEELSTFARIASINSSAAVTFRDRGAAEETLRALQVMPAIVSADIYDKGGKLFATYLRDSDADPGSRVATAAKRQAPPEFATMGVTPPGHWWDTETALQAPIRVDNETVATLILRADLGPMWQKLLSELGFVALAIVVSFAGALALTARFKRMISDPILRLTQTAAAVSRDRDYAVRVSKESNDELGLLTDRFNEMLMEIQTRDTALRIHRDELERSVQARTAELTRANERLRLAVEGSNLGLWDWDLRTGRLYLNECWGAMMGNARQEADTTLRALARHSHRDDRPAAWNAIAETLRGQRHQAEFEARIRTRSGEWRWIACIGRVVERDATGAALRMIGINNDVTEKKSAQQELLEAKEAAVAASRAKSQFLANMSHEIRTPMNGVLGMTELLQGTSLSAKQRRFVETVRGSGEALLALIDDVLDFSKIEAGKLDLETVDFDLQRLVEDVADLVAERARRKDLELMYRIADDVPTQLRGDPGRLRQILINLVGNAIKFTTKGEVVVDVRLDGDPTRPAPAGDAAGAPRAAGPGTRVRVTVTDTGIGIAEDIRDRLFQPFTQADGSMARKYGGTGLGLVICRQLVQLMGGGIGVESTFGQGSAFWFTMPFTVSAHPVAAPARDAVRGVRVLVAEGNATKQGILAHQVGRWGMRCDCASCGREAIALLHASVERGDPYELAIVDTRLPDMDGADLARAADGICAIAPRRVVLLTSTSSSACAGSADDRHSTCLAKPVHEGDLYDTVLAALGRAPIAAPALPSSSGPDRAAPSSPFRLLLAEDNPVNQEVALAMLEGLGYRIDVASDGRKAVEAWSREHHDLVLMDCQMPEMDGFAATAEIRRLDGTRNGTSAERHVVRIVALTANAMKGDRERCLAAGMDDYLGKPFTQKELRETIARWIPATLQRELADATPNRMNGAMAASGAARQEAALDPRALDAVRAMDADGSRGLLKKIVELYVESAPKLLASMHDAALRGDPDQVRYAAHTLKSSSANLGAARLSELCRKLEFEAREGKLGNAGNLATDIRTEFDKVQSALDELGVAGSGSRVVFQGD